MKIKVKVETDSELEVEADRLAVSNWTHTAPQIEMISFIATESVAKSVIATIQTGKKTALFKFHEKDVAKLSEEGYQIARSKLTKFNAVHVVAVAKTEGLVFGNMTEAVGAFIRSAEINTPVLPEWIPRLVELILAKKRIRALNCYRIEAYYCLFDSEDLDKIVTEELVAGRFTVNKETRRAS